MSISALKPGIATGQTSLFRARGFASVPPSADRVRNIVTNWRRLLGSGVSARYEAGATALREGLESHEILLLVNGLVMIERNQARGAEHVISLRFPGQLLDYFSHELRMPYQ